MPSLGFKICFVDTETEDHRTVRRIDGQWIDLGLPRGWLMACEEHGNDREPPLFKRANAAGSGAELRTLRMVDVKSISIYLSIKTGAWRIHFTSTSSIGLW